MNSYPTYLALFFTPECPQGVRLSVVTCAGQLVKLARYTVSAIAQL